MLQDKIMYTKNCNIIILLRAKNSNMHKYANYISIQANLLDNSS